MVKLQQTPKQYRCLFILLFENLYKSEINFKESICKSFDSLELPQISQAAQDGLEAPLTLDELHRALKGLNKRLNLGIDGFGI